MALVVQKFGGTSLGNVDRIRNAAKIVKTEIDLGNKVVVIASAMAGVTDSLVKMTRNFSKNSPDFWREYDSVISTGESVSAALLSIALMELEVNPVSLQGWQIPIKTTSDHSEAKITEIAGNKIFELISLGKTPVITGFQGIDESGNVTTLGRGGSDTSAVAIAVALNAERCDIYTDVDGIYTCDPNLVMDARKIDEISYEEIIDMAYNGAKVMHPRACEIAMLNNMPIRVVSSFVRGSGTLITSEENIMERAHIRGIAVKKDLALVEIKTELFDPEFISKISSAGIDVERTNFIDGSAEYLLVCDRDKLHALQNNLANDNQISQISNTVKITLTGIGIRNNQHIMQKIFQIVNNEGIKVISTSVNDNNISIFCSGDYESAVKKLHAELI